MRGGARIVPRDLFGVDIEESMGHVLDPLKRLGVVDVQPNKVLFHTGDYVESRIYQGFCYSDAQREKAMERWGHKYDRREDYRSHLYYLVARNE